MADYDDQMDGLVAEALLENLDAADNTFVDDPSNAAAGNLLAAAMDAEAEGVINDERFLDIIGAVRDYLQD